MDEPRTQSPLTTMMETLFFASKQAQGADMEHKPSRHDRDGWRSVVAYCGAGCVGIGLACVVGFALRHDLSPWWELEVILATIWAGGLMLWWGGTDDE